MGNPAQVMAAPAGSLRYSICCAHGGVDVMNEHARRTCKTTDGVFWKGADIRCFYCGCQGKPAIPPTAKCAQTWHPDDGRRNVAAA